MPDARHESVGSEQMSERSKYEFTSKEISFYQVFETKYRKMKKIFPIVLLLLAAQLLVHLWKIGQITSCDLPLKARAYYIYPVLILFCVIWMLIIEILIRCQNPSPR